MAIKPLSDQTIRRRDVRVAMDWIDIKRLIAREVMIAVDLPGAVGVNGVVADIELKQEESGSPSYKIGEWRAIVKITLPID